MLQYYDSSHSPVYKIFIGNTDTYGNFETENTLCYTGGQAGLANCAGSGRYLIWQLSSGDRNVDFAELFAYSMADLAQDGVVQISGLSNQDPSPLENFIVGNDNGDDNYCKATVDNSSLEFTVTISWSTAVDVSDIIFY